MLNWAINHASSLGKAIHENVPDLFFFALMVVVLGLYCFAWIKNYAHLKDR